MPDITFKISHFHTVYNFHHKKSNICRPAVCYSLHILTKCKNAHRFQAVPHYFTNLISTKRFFSFFKYKYKYFSIICHHIKFQFLALSNTIFIQTTTWPPAWYGLWGLTKRLSDTNSMIFKKNSEKISNLFKQLLRCKEHADTETLYYYKLLMLYTVQKVTCY
jgi:hypothetical protein